MTSPTIEYGLIAPLLVMLCGVLCAVLVEAFVPRTRRFDAQFGLALLAQLVALALVLVALVAATLVRRPSSPKHTWGYRRVEVLAALAQATVLAGTGVYVVVEAIGRFRKPPEMPSTILVAFGVVGLVGNVVSILVLASDRRSNLNMRAAFLEVANDALGSMSVIVAAIVIATTGWQRADAVAGLFIAALILPRAFKLIREAGAILMETTPRGLDLDEVREHMTRLDHVLAVHDLHASTVATGLPVISAHVVVDDGCFQDGHAIDILDDLRTCVAEHFDVAIHHSTFQLETRSARQRETDTHG